MCAYHPAGLRIGPFALLAFARERLMGTDNGTNYTLVYQLSTRSNLEYQLSFFASFRLDSMAFAVNHSRYWVHIASIAEDVFSKRELSDLLRGNHGRNTGESPRKQMSFRSSTEIFASSNLILRPSHAFASALSDWHSPINREIKRMT